MMQIIVIPAFIRRAAQVKRAAVIGQEHSIPFQRHQDDLIGLRVRRDVEVRTQPQPQSQRGEVGALIVRGRVPRRPDVGRLGLRSGKAQRVIDLARCDLVVADQPGQNRQSRRIGRGLPLRPQRVAGQVHLDPRSRLPAAVRL